MENWRMTRVKIEGGMGEMSFGVVPIHLMAAGRCAVNETAAKPKDFDIQRVVKFTMLSSWQSHYQSLADSSDAVYVAQHQAAGDRQTKSINSAIRLYTAIMYTQH